MTGIELLEQVRQESPESSSLLLTAYADTGVAIKAINDIGLDYYLLKPWDPPDERLYPVVDDLLSGWREEHPDEEAQVRVIGHRWSDQSYEVKTFLTHNHVPYRWLDVERDEEATRLLDLAEAGAEDLPLVLVPDGEALRSPSPLQMADALGLRTTRRAAAVRPVHRRRRSGRPCGSGVRRLRGAAHRRGRAGRTRWTGGAERLDRELPRVPQGTLRRGAHPPCGGPGDTLRGGDGARPRRGGLRAGAGPVRAVRLDGSGRDRGARRAHRHRRLLSPPRSARDRCARRCAASTTAPRPARRCSARARTCTSSGRPTPPVRRC